MAGPEYQAIATTKYENSPKRLTPWIIFRYARPSTVLFEWEPEKALVMNKNMALSLMR